MTPSIHFPQQKYSPEEVFSPYGRIPFTTSPAAPVDEEAEQDISIRIVENWYEEFRDAAVRALPDCLGRGADAGRGPELELVLVPAGEIAGAVEIDGVADHLITAPGQFSL